MKHECILDIWTHIFCWNSEFLRCKKEGLEGLVASRLRSSLPAATGPWRPCPQALSVGWQGSLLPYLLNISLCLMEASASHIPGVIPTSSLSDTSGLLASGWDQLFVMQFTLHCGPQNQAGPGLLLQSPSASCFSHALLLQALPLWKPLGTSPKTERKSFFPFEQFRNNNCEWNIVILLPACSFGFR